VSFDSDAMQRLLGKTMTLPEDSLRTAVADRHVSDLMERLREQAQLGQPWGTMYVEGLSMALASYVYGQYGAAKQRTDAPSLADEDLQRVTAFIEEHLGDSVSLVHLSELVGYSADHFARLFKRAFGSTPYQYVLERRVERAKSLLRGESPIAEIALLCGFASQSHLHTAFKARTGVTPNLYRRS
jgi:AraC family transcriptional regulator